LKRLRQKLCTGKQRDINTSLALNLSQKKTQNKFVSKMTRKVVIDWLDGNFKQVIKSKGGGIRQLSVRHKENCN